jgi:hypothetical protein
VAIYAGPTVSGGVRLVNDQGERLNPALGPIYTDIKDIGEKMIPVLTEEIEAIDNRIATDTLRKETLQAAIAELTAEAVPA